LVFITRMYRDTRSTRHKTQTFPYLLCLVFVLGTRTLCSKFYFIVEEIYVSCMSFAGCYF